MATGEMTPAQYETFKRHLLCPPATRNAWLDKYMRQKCEITEATKIKTYVNKLKSVSTAGKAWIADEHYRKHSIGKYREIFTIRRPLYRSTP